MKLRSKITLTLTAFSVVAMFVITAFYTNFLLEDSFARTKHRLLENSKNLALLLEYNLLDALDIVKTIQSASEVDQELQKSNTEYKNLSKNEIKIKMAKLNKIWMSKDDKNDPFIKKYTDNKLANFLKKQKKILPKIYGEIFITNKYGAMIAATGKLTTLEHDFKYWWKESYANGHGKVFFDDRGYDDSVGGYVVGVVYPVKKDGKIIGIIKANINIQSLFGNILNIYNKKGEGKVKIVRTKGLVVYNRGFPPLSTRVLPKLSRLLKSLKSGVADMKIFGNDKIVAYSPVKISLNDKNIVFGGKKNTLDHKLGNDGEIWHIVIEKNKNKILNKVLKDMKGLLDVGLGLIFLIAIVLFIMIDKMSSPLRNLSKSIKRIAEGEKDIKIEPESDDEVGELAISFRDMFKNLKKTTASRDELEKEIKERIKTQKELRKKDEIIIAQSKQAAMGEMIGMIAHQWRQPISVIAMIINNILVDIELEDLKVENVKKCGKEVLDEVEYLSQTIDDFRNFFKPDKAKEEITIKELFDNLYKIVGQSFKNNDIELSFSGDLDAQVSTYTKELLQVFINILNNAKDAMLDGDIKNKAVSISAYREDGHILFKCCDNAGGIKEKFLDKIYEPYFSTKKQKNGTGLGLYICKTIVHKHLLGKIWAQNNQDGVCFMVKLPIDAGGYNE